MNTTVRIDVDMTARYQTMSHILFYLYLQRVLVYILNMYSLFIEGDFSDLFNNIYWYLIEPIGF